MFRPETGPTRSGALLSAGALPLAATLVASGAPAWVWAALIVTGFVGLSGFTIWLARFPTRWTPPPFDASEPAGEAGRSDTMAEDWHVVRTAPDQLIAEMWVDLLRAEGVPARIKASDAVSFLGTSGLSCRVLVPEDRLADAEAVLSQQRET
ncbi:MAG: DUF2007 domain-containing protein, partial [Dehalococcoidia bacterium]|nr:DUF2007 domain-containing protein [Dehalococcoidia bacterium]